MVSPVHGDYRRLQAEIPLIVLCRFPGPALFAGTPGKRICKAKSTSALAETFSGLKRAAIALGFPTVEALRIAVKAYCRNDDVEDDLGAEAKRND
jgi:hypothetical protein